ncbi:hypothetical protein HYT26_03350, partial [Candidatus Pacearchaeota archaeon]|nr:hypothetical protein [Candidatus Pacearchaeota archaeon]
MRLKVFLFIILFALIMENAMADFVQVANTSNIEPTHAHNEVFLERNSSGSIFLLYIENVTSGADVSDVYLAYSNNNGTTWASGINISNSRKVIDYPSYSLFLRNNTFYLIYVENSSTMRNLTLKTCNNDCTNASSWVNKTTIFQGNVERPELRADSSGNLHVVFENYSASSYGNILYTRCGNTSNCFQGGNWSSPVKLSNLADYWALQPDLNIDSNNNLHVMWMDKLNNTQWDILYSTCSANANCTNSGNWSYANVTNRAAGDDDVVFVIDSNNAIHATYDDNDGEVVYVNCSSNCANSSRWSSPFNVSNSRPIKPGHSTISIDANNNLYVLWHTEETAMPSADAGRIQYRRYNAQTFSWSAIQNITTDNTHRYVTARPSTTFGNSERLDYAWQNGTSAPYVILFNSVLADVAAPVVSLNSPSNDYSTTSLSFNFSFNVTDANNIANCSLIVNNAIVGYNSSYVSNSGENNISYTFSSTGSYTWQINCTDEVNNIGNSSSRSLTISTSASPPSGSSGSSGGGGGGAASCTPRWICTGWGFCINNT